PFPLIRHRDQLLPMPAPFDVASHAEERPADLAECLVAVPAKRIFATTARSRAWASRDGLTIFVEPDGWHGAGIITGPSWRRATLCYYSDLNRLAGRTDDQTLPEHCDRRALLPARLRHVGVRPTRQGPSWRHPRQPRPLRPPGGHDQRDRDESA